MDRVEVRMRCLEMVARSMDAANTPVTMDRIVETVVDLEKFVLAAGADLQPNAGTSSWPEAFGR